MKEIWKDIIGYENYYQISNLGRVKSLSREDAAGHNLKERILKNGVSFKGYFFVNLWKLSQKEGLLVHRLVAIAFLTNPCDKPCVNHKSGIKIENEATNLEWCTHAENNEHARITGLRDDAGEANNKAKLKSTEVVQIRQSNLANKELAEVFNISQSTISLIKNNKIWRCIKI